VNGATVKERIVPTAPTGGYRYYALAGMSLVYMLNLTDRGLVMLLLEPIKQDLRLSDSQLGLITGIAFGVFYATVGVPLARWADRGNRVTIASLSIGLWGVTMAACLFVGNFVQLIAARIAAAIGEAGCKPSTYALLGDYFPEPRARTRAMSVFLAGGPLSALLSFVLGGWLNDLVGWRMTFFLMGIPGVALAILFYLTVSEPRVGRAQTIKPEPSPPMSDVLLVLCSKKSTLHLCAALILLYTLSLGLSPWYAAFMIRSHHMSTTELGLALGLIISLGGICGVLAGGFLASRYFADSARNQMRMSAVSVAALMPFLILFLTIGDAYLALGAFIPVIVVFNIFLGPTYTLLQRLVPDNMRATMMSLIMLFANLIGFGAGPQLVGLLSDWLQPTYGVDSLRYAMLLCASIALWSGFHFFIAGQSADRDLADREAVQTLPCVHESMA
jgi:predicted MFS family arabinose efflux permease